MHETGSHTSSPSGFLREELLASFAMRDSESQGRRYHEPHHPYRGAFQRDRDRVVHTKAFRRLENKTQVFAAPLSDHFRTRLTHTLEVSQISTTIGRALCLNSDFCEVLALSHDIGHPPFGHEGEMVLNEIMQSHGSGFDHNLHALRIVEDFEVKYPSFRGLNLTYEVREGIVKHSRDWDKLTCSYLDLREYEPGVKPPLEAQIIDLADEIAYDAADLDDGYRAGLLSVDQVGSEVPFLFECLEQIRKTHPSAGERIWFAESLRHLIDHLVTDLIQTTRSVIEVRAVRSVADVRSQDCRLVSFSPETASLSQRLKAFLNANLYQDDSVKRGCSSARQYLEGLFDYYMRHPENLPPHHQGRLDSYDLPAVVCDYIAGMTDSFAENRFGEIRN